MKEMRHGQVRRSSSAWAPLVAAALVVGIVAVGIAVQGVRFLVTARAFLDFYAGVFALVGLSMTVVAGLAATDRLLISIRHRILLQGLHRSTAVAALGFLAIHVTLQVAEGSAQVIDVFLPFLGSGAAVGLGTIAAALMVVVTATGVFRARYATKGRPWTWRLLHSLAYVCWPIAIMHGLTAGRRPADWVTLSYLACMAAVAVAMLVRLVVSLRAPRGGALRMRTVPRRGRVPAGAYAYPASAAYSAVPMPQRAGDGPDPEFWASLRKEVAVGKEVRR